MDKNVNASVAATVMTATDDEYIDSDHSTTETKHTYGTHTHTKLCWYLCASVSVSFPQFWLWITHWMCARKKEESGIMVKTKSDEKLSYYKSLCARSSYLYNEMCLGRDGCLAFVCTCVASMSNVHVQCSCSCMHIQLRCHFVCACVSVCCKRNRVASPYPQSSVDIRHGASHKFHTSIFLWNISSGRARMRTK